MPTLSLFAGDDAPSFEFRKSAFLRELRGDGKRYKRYCKSPIRYPGGKSLAVGLILERLPNNVDKVVSPFLGGGSVEIAIAKELDIPVIGYDIFDILVNFWQRLIDSKDELYNALSIIAPTQENYNSIKKELTAHWKGEIELDNLTLARDYYFNFNLSYGPGFLGWMSKIYQDIRRYEFMLNKIRTFDLDNLKVERADFESILPKHIDDFLYLDPPYYLEGNSRMFRGIYPQRNFPIHHNGFNHIALNQLLKNHCGGFILSYNDCNAVRDMYRDFEIYEPSWQYTMGQGEIRIGKNRIERGDDTNIKQSHELLIVGQKR
ncbi:MAG: DNA adenine methylase [Helicobacteraceae bacterium]|nr:DNA adenine methylase [Helicobacteraceae bacterium]